MICLFYSLCSPFSLVMTYIYNIHTQTYSYIHISLHSFIFPWGVSSQTYHGVPCPCKKIVQNWGWKFTPEPPGFGARSCVFNSYFQNGELSG
jgi:hypothetical protein